MLLRFVVEAHVTTCYGCVECTAHIAHATNGLSKLIIDFRIVWISKVETVRNSHRFGTNADAVARCFSHSHRAAAIRVEIHIPCVAIRCDGNSLTRQLPYSKDRGIATTAHHGIVAYL